MERKFKIIKRVTEQQERLLILISMKSSNTQQHRAKVKKINRAVYLSLGCDYSHLCYDLCFSFS